MIIDEIVFNNFRCFYGKQRIELATEHGQHVTVFHAQNGSGKTSLLNCIMWTFFGETTAGFDKLTGSIANDEHLASGGNTASVEVTFRFNKSQYRALRQFDKDKPQRKQSSNFKIWKLEINGQNTPIPHPENFIETIIPRSMAEYFFFDGEKAQSIANPINSSEISRAIRSILGCNIAEIALDDLKEVEKRYRTALSLTYSNSDLSDLSEKLETQISNRDILEAQLASADEEISTREQRISDIQGLLRSKEESARIQEQIEANESAEVRGKKRANVINSRLAKWPDENALPLVSERLLQNVEKILKDQIVEYKIPDKYQRPVIEDLLNKNSCICGRGLSPGSDEYTSVEGLLKNSADSSQIERYSKVQGELVKLKQKQGVSQESLKQNIDDQADVEIEIANAQQNLSKLKKNFKNIDNSDLQDLKRKEEEDRRELRQFISNIATSKVALEDINKQIKETQKSIDEAEKKAKVNTKLKFKKDVINKLQDEIQRQLEKHVDLARHVISASVNKFLEKAAAQPMEFSLNSDFKIKVTISGKVRPLSEGQQQLVGLVFLGALIDFCKARKSAESPLLVPGTTAPLILDAPFSKLDNEYMPEIAKVLPEMTEQLVLMLSGSQSRDEVMDTFKSNIGRQYIINRHNTSPSKPDSKRWKIDINGKIYERNLFNQEHDSSFIQEV